MATIVSRGGLNIWKDLLPYLADNTKAKDLQLVQDSIHAISMIVEDCASLLGEQAYSQIVEYILQPVFSLLAPPFTTPQALVYALETANLIMWS